MTTPLFVLQGQQALFEIITQPSGPYRVQVGGGRGIQANAVVSPDGSAPRIVALTQSAFDALDPPDASTVYIIKADA
jgi:hypothetical protein